MAELAAISEQGTPVDTALAAGTDEHGAHVTVAFTLPAGSFATVLLMGVTIAGLLGLFHAPLGSVWVWATRPSRTS